MSMSDWLCPKIYIKVEQDLWTCEADEYIRLIVS